MLPQVKTLNQHDIINIALLLDKLSFILQYVLSSGKDGCSILWELASGKYCVHHGVNNNVWTANTCTARPLNIYQPSNTKQLQYRPCALFNHTEDYGKYSSKFPNSMCNVSIVPSSVLHGHYICRVAWHNHIITA